MRNTAPKGVLLDVSSADPQAGTHLSNVSANVHGGSSCRNAQAEISTRQKDKILLTCGVLNEPLLQREASGASVGRRSSSWIIWQHMWRGISYGRKSVVRERLMQIASFTAQVAVSRRVTRYKSQRCVIVKHPLHKESCLEELGVHVYHEPGPHAAVIDLHPWPNPGVQTLCDWLYSLCFTHFAVTCYCPDFDQYCACCGLFQARC